MSTEGSKDTKSLPLLRAYPFLGSNGLGAEAELIRASEPRTEGWDSRIRRGMVVEILKSKGLLDRFISECWPVGATEEGKRHIAIYEKWYAQWKTSHGTHGDAEPDEPSIVAPGATADAFAYEQDLRDYLARNLSLLEPGMRLFPSAQGEGAVEFRVDDNGRRADILAEDKDGTPVVIELKVSEGHERTIGQALYYRAMIKERFNVPKVRIILVAREISRELQLATRDLHDVALFEYRLSMTLSRLKA